MFSKCTLVLVVRSSQFCARNVRTAQKQREAPDVLLLQRAVLTDGATDNRSSSAIDGVSGKRRSLNPGPQPSHLVSTSVPSQSTLFQLQKKDFCLENLA